MKTGAKRRSNTAVRAKKQVPRAPSLTLACPSRHRDGRAPKCSNLPSPRRLPSPLAQPARGKPQHRKRKRAAVWKEGISAKYPLSPTRTRLGGFPSMKARGENLLRPRPPFAGTQVSERVIPVAARPNKRPSIVVNRATRSIPHTRSHLQRRGSVSKSDHAASSRKA